MVSNRIRFAVMRSPMHGAYELYVMFESLHGELSAAKHPLEFEVVDEADYGKQQMPLLRMSEESTSMLMDELWSAGVRPSNGAGSHATHSAMQAHLDDLQKIVFRDYKAPACED